ncbi:MAG: peptidase M14 [Candidatus Nealsonbacteria bacterium]|nr:peptidase M14 [Candidatus Nealsonbacteria bacterium]
MNLTRTFLQLFIALLLVVPCVARHAAAEERGDLETWYEAHDCNETPRYRETVDFCKRLEAASPWIRYASFGTTPQGRELPLLIVDKNGHFDAASVRRSGNAVVLIQACIHAGEPDGKDAGLLLLRDLATGKVPASLLQRVTVLFLPIFNADGHERFGPYSRINQNGPVAMGWRTTARNLNLNRDFVKADAPEMRAWLKLYNRWLPDFLIDCHTTDGADFQYPLTYGLQLRGGLDENVAGWTRDVYLPSVERGMAAARMPIFPYVQFRKWHDPRSGLKSGVTAAMYSHGYAAVRNRPGLLVETHMLKDYKTRVEATYRILHETLSVLNREHRTLRTLVEQADHDTADVQFRRRELPVAFELSDESVPVEFLGVDYEVVRSDLTGGDWVRYSRTPKTFTVDHFNKPKASRSVVPPEAYLLPPEWPEIIALLDAHGIRYTKLDRPHTVAVGSYKFRDVQFRSVPYEGRMNVDDLNYDAIEEPREFPAGSVLIPLDQPTARLIVYMFEPGSKDSLVRWGFFNAIFEQKEYSESYVMERMAREMLAKDEDLKRQYEQKKADDAEFAADSRAQLNWFYAKTPWFDVRHNVYPVGRVTDRDVVKGLGR